jgi:CTP:molybdopterin cytidylyltransferase MocA
VNAVPPGAGLLLAADQVAVTADDLKAPRNRMAAPSGADRGGATTASCRPSFRLGIPDLLGLRGESDPRIVIHHSDRVVRVSMPTAAIDVNTPEDLLAVGARGPGRVEPDRSYHWAGGSRPV